MPFVPLSPPPGKNGHPPNNKPDPTNIPNSNFVRNRRHMVNLLIKPLPKQSPNPDGS
jgi:hypothetical protein